MISHWLILLVACISWQTAYANSIVEKSYYLDQPTIQITPELVKNLNATSEFEVSTYGRCQLVLICNFSVHFPEKIEQYRYFYTSISVYKNEKLKLFFDKVDIGFDGSPMSHNFFLGRDKFNDARLYLFYVHYEDLKKRETYREGGLGHETRIRIYQLDLNTLLTPEKMRVLPWEIED